jgi:3-oxoadipate enol-lactonase
MPQLTLNAARHYYRLEGAPSRAPLVLVHPIGADHSLWDLLVPHLLSQFQVLRYDLRGHGGSEATTGEFSIELLADDLLAVASAVGWNEFSVCGVSVGGMTAAKAAALAPKRIKSLIVCSAAPHMHAPPGGWDARAATARTSGLQSLAGPMVERMFSPAFRESAHPHIETLRNVFLSTNPEGYASTIAVLRDADLRGALRGIKAPTLIVTGKHDPLVPALAGTALSMEIVGSRHEELAAGHFPPVEAPEQFASLLFNHLSAQG